MSVVGCQSLDLENSDFVIVGGSCRRRRALCVVRCLRTFIPEKSIENAESRGDDQQGGGPPSRVVERRRSLQSHGQNRESEARRGRAVGLLASQRSPRRVE